MENSAVNEKWISIDEAADYLGIKPVTIRSWIRNNKDIPAHKSVSNGNLNVRSLMHG